ncbi:MAG: hypothetical protein EHM65_10665 [Acidobacteriales bacterium]|nr:MAG: hypothetical protein EHM65_10665 [Terriglobales bacterium]
MRLEVALIGNRELFAWPGAGKFGEKEITQMIEWGARGTGSFAVLATSIFLGRGPSFAHLGEEERGQRRVVRYRYWVPAAESGYWLRHSNAEAKVGFHGLFWVDAETLDLVRLEVAADEIPPALELTEANQTIEYSRMAIGDATFLLPASAEMLVTQAKGSSHLNRTQFSGCRQYAAKSSVSFGGTASADGPAAPVKIVEVELPADMFVDLMLETGIDSATSVVGDEVKARLMGDVWKDDAVIIPSGTIVAGRIVDLQRFSRPFTNYRLGLHFPLLESWSNCARFSARLAAAQLGSASTFLTGRLRLPSPSGTRSVLVIAPSEQIPGVGVMNITGERVRIGSGLRLFWRTVATRGEQEK